MGEKREPVLRKTAFFGGVLEGSQMDNWTTEVHFVGSLEKQIGVCFGGDPLSWLVAQGKQRGHPPFEGSPKNSFALTEP